MIQKNDSDSLGISVDWFSFSVFCPDALTSKPGQELAHIADAIEKILGSDMTAQLMDAKEWQEAAPRRPYRHCMKQEDTNLSIYFGGQEWVLVEMSGVTCSYFNGVFPLNKLLVAAKGHATRLDVAIDVKPGKGNAKDIAASCTYKRSKSRGSQVSSKGSTFYIGSKTSERFVRVYEYNEPHPRAGVPRIEFVARKQNAEYVINSIAANGISFAAQSLLNTFSFKDINVENHDETIAAVRKDRKDSKTLHWILTQCAPAIKRLIRNGTIENPEEFINKHIMPEEVQEVMF